MSILEEVRKWQNVIKEAIDGSTEFNNIWFGVGFIIGFALFIFLIKDIFTLLAKGESIDPIKHIATPLFFVLIYVLFNEIIDFITSMTNRLGELFLTPSLDENAADKMNELLAEIKTTMAKRDFTKEGFFENLSNNMKASFTLGFIESMQKAGLWLDEIFISLFAAYTQIMIELLKIVAPISFALSFLPGLKSTFLTWLKSFISVNLWFGVAALIFRLVNSMSFSYFDYKYGNITDTSEYTYGMAITIGLTFIGLGIFKGILMFKTPQVVAMFTGSSASGSLFGSALAPALVGLGAAKLAAKPLGNAAKAGAKGVGSLIKKFKSKE